MTSLGAGGGVCISRCHGIEGGPVGDAGWCVCITLCHDVEGGLVGASVRQRASEMLVQMGQNKLLLVTIVQYSLIRDGSNRTLLD